MPSFVDLLCSCCFSLQVSNGSVKLVSDFVSSSASGTEGEDHFPKVAASSCGLLLQILNLDIIGLHSLPELFLDSKENIIELVRSYGAVSLNFGQNFDDQVDLFQLSTEVILLAFNLIFPDFEIIFWS